MGHGGHTCCNKQKVKRGLWSPEEDEKLVNYITAHGHGCWSSVPKLAGLQRCGKSCRLRWINYLRPDLKRGSFSSQEATLIVDLHRILGNRWAQIAKHLPGRTDNEVKNFWNSSIKKKLLAHSHLNSHPLATVFPSPKNDKIPAPVNGDHEYYGGFYYANPNNPPIPYEPQLISDQDGHLQEPPPIEAPMTNLDQGFDIDPNVYLPPLPASLLGNSSSSVLDHHHHQFPTLGFPSSYDHNFLKQENYDFFLGQNSDPNLPLIPFKLSEMNNMDLLANSTSPTGMTSQPSISSAWVNFVNPHDLHMPASPQMEYLETFMTNFPSPPLSTLTSSSSPPSSSASPLLTWSRSLVSKDRDIERNGSLI